MFCKKKKKKGVLKTCKFHRKTAMLESLFNKVASLRSYFEEHLRTTACVQKKKEFRNLLGHRFVSLKVARVVNLKLVFTD